MVAFALFSGAIDGCSGVGCDVFLGDGLLEADVVLVLGGLAQGDLEHGDLAFEDEVVKTFFERLVFVLDVEGKNLVLLVKSDLAVLDEFNECEGLGDCGAGSLDNNGGLFFLSGEQVHGVAQVLAGGMHAFARVGSDANLVLGCFFFALFYAPILFHLS